MVHEHDPLGFTPAGLNALRQLSLGALSPAQLQAGGGAMWGGGLSHGGPFRALPPGAAGHLGLPGMGGLDLGFGGFPHHHPMGELWRDSLGMHPLLHPHALLAAHGLPGAHLKPPPEGLAAAPQRAPGDDGSSFCAHLSSFSPASQPQLAGHGELLGLHGFRSPYPPPHKP